MSDFDPNDVQLLPNITFDEYSAIPAINASTLKGIGQYSPKHLKACLDREIPDSDSVDRRLGRAIHCMMLEPERFATDFPESSWCCALLKSGESKGKPCGCSGIYRDGDDWYCGKHAADGAVQVADFVTPAELKRIKKLRLSVMGEPAGELFRSAEVETELTVVWTQFGFRLKCRIDYASLQPRRIVELKKMLVGKGRDEDLKHECGKRGYHIQAWFQIAAYMAAMDKVVFDAEADAHVRPPRPDMWFLFSEDNVPFCANALEVDDTDLVVAQRTIKQSLEAFGNCQKTGKYFGYQAVLNPDKRGITTDFFRSRFLDKTELTGFDDDN